MSLDKNQNVGCANTVCKQLYAYMLICLYAYMLGRL